MAGTRPATGKSEIPRRPGDGHGSSAARRPGDGSDTGVEEDPGRRLIVGRDISLTGEISACDHLIVEGRIEARIGDCKTLAVANGGTFKGSADIGDAEIAGRFEGDLSVQGRLTLRSTGVINGTIKYGELSVDAGGQIIGQTEPINASESVVTPLVDPARRAQPQVASAPVGSNGASAGHSGSGQSTGAVSSSTSLSSEAGPG